MMEPVSLPLAARVPPPRPWAVTGLPATRRNLITSIHLDHDVLEAHVRQLHVKYESARRREVRYEEYAVADARVILIGYGIVSRVLRRAVGLCRAAGIKAGLLRPITLWPFPSERISELARGAARLMAVELSTGQMVEDVRLAVAERCPVDFLGRWGGNVPSSEEVVDTIVQRMRELSGDEAHVAHVA